MLKNTIVATVKKWVLFVGTTFTGHVHDFTMLKTEFPPEHPWFALLEAVLDLGYQGIQTAYEGEQVHIPHKKPSKSKHNPQPTLTPEQKAENQALSRTRFGRKCDCRDQTL